MTGDARDGAHPEPGLPSNRVQRIYRAGGWVDAGWNAGRVLYVSPARADVVQTWHRVTIVYPVN